MLCQIYRSSRKAETYLYVPFKYDLASLPELLQKQLGELTQVMLLDLSKRERLANADIESVKAAINDQGFYLQLPPGPEEYLSRAKGGASSPTSEQD